MIGSLMLMAIIVTIITEKFVEPRLGSYTGGVPVEGGVELSATKWHRRFRLIWRNARVFSP